MSLCSPNAAAGTPSYTISDGSRGFRTPATNKSPAASHQRRVSGGKPLPSDANTIPRACPRHRPPELATAALCALTLWRCALAGHCQILSLQSLGFRNAHARCPSTQALP